jgi:hypothetical protein
MEPKKFTNEYQICIDGQLDQRWFDAFESLCVAHTPNGETLISGVMDQSALYGILNRIRDLGLALISVQRRKVENKIDYPKRK